MPGVVSAIHSLANRSKHDRAAWYREHAEQFQRLAEMETRPRVRVHLLELADEYTQLADAKSPLKSNRIDMRGLVAPRLD